MHVAHFACLHWSTKKIRQCNLSTWSAIYFIVRLSRQQIKSMPTKGKVVSREQIGPVQNWLNTHHRYNIDRKFQMI